MARTGRNPQTGAPCIDHGEYDEGEPPVVCWYCGDYDCPGCPPYLAESSTVAPDVPNRDQRRSGGLHPQEASLLPAQAEVGATCYQREHEEVAAIREMVLNHGKEINDLQEWKIKIMAAVAVLQGIGLAALWLYDHVLR